MRRAIANQETLDADNISKDDQCPLGQWIHGAGSTQCTDRHIYDDLLNTHAEFHRTAGSVARQINAGQYNQAEKLIESSSRFAEMSSKVAMILSRAKKSCR